MILCIWNFEYALALKSMKTLVFHCVRHQMNLFMPFIFRKSIFSSKDRKNDLNYCNLFAFVRLITSM